MWRKVDLKIENGVLKSVQPKDLRGGVFRINAVHKLLDRIHSLTGIGKSGQITSIDGMAFAECEKVLIIPLRRWYKMHENQIKTGTKTKICTI